MPPNDEKSDESLERLIQARIEAVARLIGGQHLGLAVHAPEPFAETARCFENVAHKVFRDGGRTMFGWTFHHRRIEDIPGPGYLFLTHHAVWHAPDGRLVDVTPYPEPQHKPLRASDGIIFLADREAKPIRKGNIIAPRPLRFFGLNQDERLAAHVAMLEAQERATCEAIYAGQMPPTKA